MTEGKTIVGDEELLLPDTVSKVLVVGTFVVESKGSEVWLDPSELDWLSVDGTSLLEVESGFTVPVVRPDKLDVRLASAVDVPATRAVEELVGVVAFEPVLVAGKASCVEVPACEIVEEVVGVVAFGFVAVKDTGTAVV